MVANSTHVTCLGNPRNSLHNNKEGSEGAAQLATGQSFIDEQKETFPILIFFTALLVKTIIEFGFRRIWKILQISEGVIHRGRNLQNSSYPTKRHSIITKYT